MYEEEKSSTTKQSDFISDHEDFAPEDADDIKIEIVRQSLVISDSKSDATEVESVKTITMEEAYKKVRAKSKLIKKSYIQASNSKCLQLFS